MITELLLEWETYCKLSEKRHNAAKTFYNYINYILTISSLTLLSISNISSLIVSSISTKQHDELMLVIIFNTISIFSIIIIITQRVLGLIEKANVHNIYSDLYMSLANEITFNTINNINDFFIFYKCKLDFIINQSPQVPNFIIKKYPTNTVITSMYLNIDEIYKTI